MKVGKVALEDAVAVAVTAALAEAKEVAAAEAAAVMGTRCLPPRRAVQMGKKWCT